MSWQEELRLFFDTRAGWVDDDPGSLVTLALASGRDPRIWAHGPAREEMLASILELVRAGPTARVLEVGPAAGFIATGLAPRVGRYVGVDVSGNAVAQCRNHGLANAEFHQGDGSALPFPAGSFDAALCYDVFTNLPEFGIGAAIIEDMLRVVRPGGRVLIGSVPDVALEQPFQARVREVVAELTDRFGTMEQYVARSRSGLRGRVVQAVRSRAPRALRRLGARLASGASSGPRLLARIRSKLGRATTAPSLPPDQGKIICFYFDRGDFVALGARLGAAVELVPVHPANPYAAYRFNVVFTRGA